MSLRFMVSCVFDEGGGFLRSAPTARLSLPAEISMETFGDKALRQE